VSKERISATVDPENAEFLNQAHINTSGLINKLLTQYRTGGASEDIIREFRLQQLQNEAEEAEARAERKHEEMERLKEVAAESDRVDDGHREALLEKVRKVPKDADHPLIQDTANELDADPEDIIAEAYDR